jgi:hypothetical protein
LANSPYEQYKRERGKIGIAVFGLDPSGIGPLQKACPDCHQTYSIIIDKETKRDVYFCRGCGDKVPIKKPKPKESKVRQKVSCEQNKQFISQVGPTRKRKGGLHGFSDGTEFLDDDELDYVTRLGAGVTISSET